MEIFYYSTIIAMILFYAHDTNVIFSYLKLFLDTFKNNNYVKKIVGGRLLIGSYSPARNGPYLRYLNSSYGTFLSELVSCEICVGAWLSLIAAILIGDLILIGAIAFISLIFYYIIKSLTKLISRV